MDTPRIYLTDMFKLSTGKQVLRSSARTILGICRTCDKSFGDCSFSVPVPLSLEQSSKWYSESESENWKQCYFSSFNYFVVAFAVVLCLPYGLWLSFLVLVTYTHFLHFFFSFVLCSILNNFWLIVWYIKLIKILRLIFHLIRPWNVTEPALYKIYVHS